mmetsp:Transcript_26279/g.40725  ORF Transcript_26279/g.40725 Transcript_26279/m.40725 type:complete len:688 (+) Transcript_26279:84-2147(+)|eukprot:CAMPEP_0196809384 /NCGR_PEP_ID=MMETSP1362-20130617/9327_1 /TAXON_ID=163516 /ORGANISM="Leptocylindrus danicus, Strain CCMP1856" /LENGTH=687 /DNA_ID=CAMNT_0042184061 /DNA_START=101 /DNA_END=2164 /DNA_ORIENTATION=+
MPSSTAHTAIIEAERTLVESPTSLNKAVPLLHSSTSLSFWGGIDPETGIIIDQTHPLHGQCVAGTILALPSGRGSCTGSQVLLELILNGIAPTAIVTRDVDPILCVGAIIAQEFFCGLDTDGNGEDISSSPNVSVPMVLHLGKSSFDQMRLMSTTTSFAGIVVDHSNKQGQVIAVVGTDKNDVEEQLHRHRHRPTRSNNSNRNKNYKLELTDEEAAMLRGEVGSAADQIALRTLCRIASITEAPKLISVTQAHIDGCTYIGPGGLRFVEKLVELGGRVSVPTTLNSVSADRRRWAALGVSPELARPANLVGDAYLKLGCTESFTCAPYLLPSRPGLGEDIVWGESNAVVYSNSVLGARTDKVADYADICSALVGKVPYYGVHVEQNRLPGIVIDVRRVVEDHIVPLMNHHATTFVENDVDAFFPTLGYLTGILSDGFIPIIVGMEALKDVISKDDLKAFCAAFGTTGTAPLAHIAHITPEASGNPAKIDDMIQACRGRFVEVTNDHLGQFYQVLDSGASGTEEADTGDVNDDNVDLVSFGNPHLSLDECQRLASLVSLSSTSKGPDVKVMATLSRHVYEEAKSCGYINTLESFGMQFINDTCWCMLLDPPIIPPKETATIMTNSGKYAHYGPGLTKRRIRFGSMSQCIDAATSGVMTSKRPIWLQQKRGFASLLMAGLSRGRVRRFV